MIAFTDGMAMLRWPVDDFGANWAEYSISHSGDESREYPRVRSNHFKVTVFHDGEEHSTSYYYHSDMECSDYGFMERSEGMVNDTWDMLDGLKKGYMHLDTVGADTTDGCGCGAYIWFDSNEPWSQDVFCLNLLRDPVFKYGADRAKITITYDGSYFIFVFTAFFTGYIKQIIRSYPESSIHPGVTGMGSKIQELTDEMRIMLGVV